ncbi:hypothetical protein F0562_027494 [Nyssa sinensis]|uniref:Uncharacterized protein n=1 Tax=Nyssa sinensis TaxID=561372 RepID=A0A5J5B6K2_9ASTE|nr:hypothetical protein F0562_027494 [Nyssa sinensis]
MECLSTMEIVAGMVGVDMVEEVEGGEEAVAVRICNKSWVVAMTMVDQGQRQLKAAVLMSWHYTARMPEHETQ